MVLMKVEDRLEIFSRSKANFGGVLLCGTNGHGSRGCSGGQPLQPMVWLRTSWRYKLYIDRGKQQFAGWGDWAPWPMTYPWTVGDFVTVGHGAILHACTIEDECLIGMGATILDGAHIGKQSIIAAGTVVPMGMQVPPGSLWSRVCPAN